MTSFDLDRMVEAVWAENISVRDALEEAFAAGYSDGWNEAQAEMPDVW